MMFLFQSAIHVQYVDHIVIQMYKHGVHKYYIVVQMYKNVQRT